MNKWDCITLSVLFICIAFTFSSCFKYMDENTKKDLKLNFVHEEQIKNK